jgi:hypothetical protein
MNTISVPLHFACEQTPLEEKEAWINLSIERLGSACNPDEIEYSLDLVKEVNPEYKERYCDYTNSII